MTTFQLGSDKARSGIVNLMKKSLLDPFLVRKADGLQVVKIKGGVKEENYR